MLATTKSNTIQATASDKAIAAAWIAQLDASDKTRATYERSIRRWLAWLADNGLAVIQADRRAVLAYKRALEASAKPSTVNAYLSAVRGLYAWLEAEGIMPNIAASVKGCKRSAHSSKDALTLAQVRELLADVPAEGASLKALRDYAMVNLMARRGLRCIEVVRANIGDVRQVAGQAVLFVQGKGYSDKGEFVVLNESVLRPLYRYLEARGCRDPEAPLFASTANRNNGQRVTTDTVADVVKAAYSRHGIAGAGLTAHSLRHTAVTLALLADAPLQEVQAMARHRSINTTMIYAHNLRRMDAGAEHAVDRIIGAA